jgi:hypothetical protein
LRGEDTPPLPKLQEVISKIYLEDYRGASAALLHSGVVDVENETKQTDTLSAYFQGVHTTLCKFNGEPKDSNVALLGIIPENGISFVFFSVEHVKSTVFWAFELSVTGEDRPKYRMLRFHSGDTAKNLLQAKRPEKH